MVCEIDQGIIIPNPACEATLFSNPLEVVPQFNYSSSIDKNSCRIVVIPVRESDMSCRCTQFKGYSINTILEIVRRTGSTSTVSSKRVPLTLPSTPPIIALTLLLTWHIYWTKMAVVSLACQAPAPASNALKALIKILGLDSVEVAETSEPFNPPTLSVSTCHPMTGTTLTVTTTTWVECCKALCQQVPSLGLLGTSPQEEALVTSWLEDASTLIVPIILTPGTVHPPLLVLLLPRTICYFVEQNCVGRKFLTCFL